MRPPIHRRGYFYLTFVLYTAAIAKSLSVESFGRAGELPPASLSHADAIEDIDRDQIALSAQISEFDKRLEGENFPNEYNNFVAPIDRSIGTLSHEIKPNNNLEAARSDQILLVNQLSMLAEGLTITVENTANGGHGPLGSKPGFTKDMGEHDEKVSRELVQKQQTMFLRLDQYMKSGTPTRSSATQPVPSSDSLAAIVREEEALSEKLSGCLSRLETQLTERSYVGFDAITKVMIASLEGDLNLHYLAMAQSDQKSIAFELDRWAGVFQAAADQLAKRQTSPVQGTKAGFSQQMAKQDANDLRDLAEQYRRLTEQLGQYIKAQESRESEHLGSEGDAANEIWKRQEVLATQVFLFVKHSEAQLKPSVYSTSLATLDGLLKSIRADLDGSRGIAPENQTMLIAVMRNWANEFERDAPPLNGGPTPGWAKLGCTHDMSHEDSIALVALVGEQQQLVDRVNAYIQSKGVLGLPKSDHLQEQALEPSSTPVSGRRGRGSNTVVDGKTSPAGYSRHASSPDGTRVAYFGGDGVIVDGQKQGSGEIDDVSFSPDSRHIAFIEHHVPANGPISTEQEDSRGVLVFVHHDSYSVVYDGHEGPVYDSLSSRIVFDETGRHFAYRASLGEREFVVLDGLAGPSFGKPSHTVTLMLGLHQGDLAQQDESSGPLVFSDDGNHLAYAAKKGGNWVVLRDGKEDLPYEVVGGIRFSADGNHLFYAANRANKWVTVLDGKEGPEFGWVGPIALSSNGQRLAYLASQVGKDPAMMIDGKLGPTYKEVGPPVFSADGLHVMYLANRSYDPQSDRGVNFVNPTTSYDAGWYDQHIRLMLMNQKRHGYDTAVFDDRTVYGEIPKVALDSGLIACVVKDERQHRSTLMVNGNGVAIADYIDNIFLDQDGQHVACIAQTGTKHYMVVDGKVSGAFDRILNAPAPPTFLPNGSVLYVAERDGTQFQVTQGR